MAFHGPRCRLWETSGGGPDAPERFEGAVPRSPLRPSAPAEWAKRACRGGRRAVNTRRRGDLDEGPLLDNGAPGRR